MIIAYPGRYCSGEGVRDEPYLPYIEYFTNQTLITIIDLKYTYDKLL